MTSPPELAGGLDPVAQLAASLPGTYASYGPTAPTTNPAGQVWVSESIARLTADPSPASRNPIGIAGQEPSVWYANGKYNMIFTGGNAHLQYTSCTGDPTKAANWAAPVDVIGGGAGGFAGTGVHGYVYVEGSTLYCYFIDSATQNTRVATAAITAPTVWTTQAAIVLGPQGTGTNGNVCVVKDGSTYRMFQECLHTDTFPGDGVANTWQVVMATCSTPTGTFTPVLNPVTTLRPTNTASVSGMWIGQENGVWVAYFHSGSWGRSMPNDIYRATTTNLATDSWTVTDNAAAVLKRSHKYEVDQVADPYLCQSPGGQWFMFYEGCDNRTQQFQMMCAPLHPALHTWDGAQFQPSSRKSDPRPVLEHRPFTWQNAPLTDPTGQRRTGTWATDGGDPTRPVIASLAGDFSTTNVWASIVTFTFTPRSSQVLVDIAACVSNSGASTQCQFRVVSGAQTVTLGIPYSGAGGTQFAMGGKALLTGLTPGTQITIDVQGLATAGSLQIRHASLPTYEYLIATAVDAATPSDPAGGVVRRYNTSNTQNDAIEFDVVLAPGTYRLDVFSERGPTSAIRTVDIDDGAAGWYITTLGTIDEYSATVSTTVLSSVSFTIYGTETIRRSLRFKAATRNASATGWYLKDRGWQIVRTDT